MYAHLYTHNIKQETHTNRYLCSQSSFGQGSILWNMR